MTTQQTAITLIRAARALELGVSVLLDKPIIVVAPPDRYLPDHLIRVADDVIEWTDDHDELSRRITAAVERLTLDPDALLAGHLRTAMRLRTAQCVVIGYRDDDVLLICTPCDDDALDRIVSVGRLAAVILQLEALVLIVDTYHSTLPKNPATGQDWRPGDMADLAEDGDAIARGWITDALIGHWIQPDASRLAMVPYTRTDPPVWGEVTPLAGGQSSMQSLWDPPPPGAPIDLDALDRRTRDDFGCRLIRAEGYHIAIEASAL